MRYLSLFFTCLAVTAYAASVNVDMVRMNPSTVPTVCSTGDLRVDQNDSTKLKICRSNVWYALLDSSLSGVVTDVTGTSPIVSSGGTTPAISIPVATSSVNGYLAATDWVIFNAKVPSTRTINTTSPLTGGGDLSANLTIAIPAATTSVDGYLTSTDWNTFNGKQASGNYITALTGDVTASGPGSAAATVAFVAASSAANVHAAELLANAATNLNTASAIVRRDGSGNFVAGTVTAALTGNASTATALAANPTDCSASNFANAIAASGNLTCAQPAFSDLSGSVSASQMPALTGDITTSAGSVATTLATVNSNVGSFGSSTSIPTFTVNGKGLITAASGNVVIAPAGTLTGTTLASNVVTSSLTAVGIITSGTWTGTTIAVANGGTGRTSLTNHGVLVGATTTAITQLAAGSAGQALLSGGASADPAYSTPTYPSSSGTSGKVLVSDGTNNVYSTPTFPNASATAGKHIVSDGTNWVASTPTFPNTSATAGKVIRSDGTNFAASTFTIPDTAVTSDLLYASATNVWSSLAKTNTAALITNSSGVPAWTAGSVANRLLRTDGSAITFAQAAIATDISGLGANVATWLATPSSANLLAAVTDETGTGVLVFGTTPTFTTSIIDPLIIGGTGTTSTLTLRTTSGVGTTNADMIFQVGNNGATEAMRITNAGNVGIGTTSPKSLLNIYNTVAAGAAEGISLTSANQSNSYVRFYTKLSDLSESVGGSNPSGNNKGWQIYSYGNADPNFPNDFLINYWSGSAWTNPLTLRPSGNVGIGTTFPSSLLHVGSNSSPGGTAVGGLFATNLPGNTYDRTVIVGGTQTAAASGNSIELYVAPTIAAGVTQPTKYGLYVESKQGAGTATNYYPAVFMGGNVGIGTTAPSTQLHTTGGVRFANFGAGTATFDANGNISSVSDERLKDIQGDFTSGLAQLKLINPIVYKWKKETGFDPVNDYVGFSAQNVKAAIPSAIYTKKTFIDANGEQVQFKDAADKAVEFVQSDIKSIEKNNKGKPVRIIVSVKDKDGEPVNKTIELPAATEEKETLSLSDRPIIAALVNAVKELAQKSEELELRIQALESK